MSEGLPGQEADRLSPIIVDVKSGYTTVEDGTEVPTFEKFDLRTIGQKDVNPTLVSEVFNNALENIDDRLRSLDEIGELNEDQVAEQEELKSLRPFVVGDNLDDSDRSQRLNVANDDPRLEQLRHWVYYKS